MKKTALLIMALGLFAFATAGCEDAYKASSPETNNNTVVQEIEKISFNPPKTLIEVVEGLDSNSSIIQLSAIEPYGSRMQVVLTQPYSDVEGILLEYNQAREKQLQLTQESNTRDLGHFSTSQLDGADKAVDALLIEKENIETAIATKMNETILVSEIAVKKQ